MIYTKYHPRAGDARIIVDEKRFVNAIWDTAYTAKRMSFFSARPLSVRGLHCLRDSSLVRMPTS